MSALRKELLLRALPPLPTAGRSGGRMPRRGRDYSPLPWSGYFDRCQDLTLRTGDCFRVYCCGSTGPALLLLHGGGHSALSWALFARAVSKLVECQVVAVDLRGHGETVTSDPGDLSADTLTRDVGSLAERMFGGTSTPVVLLGHSMGGAVAVRAAAAGAVPNLVGLTVIDVVEGTAVDSLTSMQSYLRGRPAFFRSLQHAVEWSIRSGQLRNVESARVSMPGQLRRVSQAPSSSSSPTPPPPPLNTSSDLSHQTISEEAAAHQTISDQTISEETAAHQTISHQTISEETVAHQTISEEAAAHQTISEETAAHQTISHQTISEETVAHQTISEEAAAHQTISSQTISEETVTHQTISDQTISEEAAAHQTISHQTISEETVAHQTISEEAAAHQTISEEAAAHQTISSQTISEETVTHQTISDQTISEETATHQTISDQTISEEAPDTSDHSEVSAEQNLTTSKEQHHKVESDHKYTWRIDLSKTECFWRSWFDGLSKTFLTTAVPKMLILAGVDRLDKELTIGQMQGKFQMVVLSGCGHSVHEDSPDKVASIISDFLIRYKLTEKKADTEQITFSAHDSSSVITTHSIKPTEPSNFL